MKKLLIFLVILANLIGAYFGFFVYYKEQIAGTVLPMLVFVADSPLSTLLFALALGLILIGKKNDFMNFFASAYVLKYGLWTLFILIYYSNYFFSPENKFLYVIMFVTHIGMVIESLALIKKTTISKLFFPVTLLWFLLNDFMDYVVGTLPSSIPTDNLGFVSAITVFISIFSCFVLYKFFREKKFLGISRVLF